MSQSLRCPKCNSPGPDVVRQQVIYERDPGNQSLRDALKRVETLCRCSQCQVMFVVVEPDAGGAAGAPEL